MSIIHRAIDRPKRWDAPFSDEISDSEVDHLLTIPPFSAINEAAFPPSLPLRSILKNDCRIISKSKGELIIREGDYGNSAFLILEGLAEVCLDSLPSRVLGRKQSQSKSWLQAISQLWTNSRVPESRKNPASNASSNPAEAVFLQDIPKLVDQSQKVTLEFGELFGELAALTRTPRSATVVAGSECRLLEIRWQGFRDLLKRDPAIRIHVEKLYRENSLRVHLRNTPILKHVDDSDLDQIAEATQFETFGNFDWNNQFESIEQQDVAERILAEPVIAEQGGYVDGLILIRNGFARISQAYGNGHRTIAYIGKGETFGLRELYHNFANDVSRPYLLSMRAVGYVDIIRIPTSIVEQFVFPTLDDRNRPPALPDPDAAGSPGNEERRQTARSDQVNSSLLEFLVENRFVNGTEAMVIDMDRCTRCDDCVRACATAHDNNPRFLRQGPVHDRWMVAGACMHCVDPVCMIGCPTGAIGRDAKTGSVLINDDTCIGCGTCANSCPYHNIRMVDIRDRSGNPLIDRETREPIRKATKCDLCVDQLGGPACQRACPHDALERINLTTPVELYQLEQR